MYVTEGSTHHGTDTASELLGFLFYSGLSGVTVLKGVAGFGADPFSLCIAGVLLLMTNVITASKSSDYLNG